jgi:hypothetical protein
VLTPSNSCSTQSHFSCWPLVIRVHLLQVLTTWHPSRKELDLHPSQLYVYTRSTDSNLRPATMLEYHRKRLHGKDYMQDADSRTMLLRRSQCGDGRDMTATTFHVSQQVVGRMDLHHHKRTGSAEIRTWLFLDTDLPTLNSKEPTAQAPHPAHEFGNAEGKAPWNFAHPVQFFKVAPQPLKSSASLRGANRSMHTLNAPSSPNTIGASD